MRAKVLKVVAIESHSTIREVMAALREVLKEEGKAANEWTVVVVEKPEEDANPTGLNTGQGFHPPDVSPPGTRSLIGFKK